jgi:sodium pump decarboxylase gamma subunit
MISEGLMILCIGVGIVFLFFTVLTMTMQALAICIAFLDKKFPEKVAPSKQSVSTNSQAGNDPNKDHIALAIAAARVRLK